MILQRTLEISIENYIGGRNTVSCTAHVDERHLSIKLLTDHPTERHAVPFSFYESWETGTVNVDRLARFKGNYLCRSKQYLADELIKVGPPHLQAIDFFHRLSPDGQRVAGIATCMTLS